MLDVTNLTKTFGSGSKNLQGLLGRDMELRLGEQVALMGRSGSGESTVLDIIGGLVAGDCGEIHLNDSKYGKMNSSSVVHSRRDLGGWIFEDFHPLDKLTAVDNGAVALGLSGMPAQDAE